MLGIIIGVAVAVIAGIVIVLVKKNSGIKSGDADAQLNHAERTLKKKPQDPSALMAAGTICYQRRDFGKAKAYFHRLTETSSSSSDEGVDNAAVFQYYGLSCYHTNDIDKAYQALLIALSIKKEGNAEICRTLGQIDFKRREYKKALVNYKKALVFSPKDMAVRRNVGICYVKMKRYSDAIPFLEEVFSRNTGGQDVDLIFNLAEANQAMNKMEKALDYYDKLLDDKDMSGEAHFRRGLIYRHMRNISAFITEFKESLHHSLSRDNLQAVHYSLAQTFIKQRKIKEAQSHLEQSMQIDPGYKESAKLKEMLQVYGKNPNLNIAMNGNMEEFTELCKKVALLVNNAETKITDVKSGGSVVEFVAMKSENGKDVSVYFLFSRNDGDLEIKTVKDMVTVMRQNKCAEGYCFTLGNFSQQAREFCQNRVIELYPGNAFVKYLQKAPASE